jgi:hypothetical protein
MWGTYSTDYYVTTPYGLLPRMDYYVLYPWSMTWGTEYCSKR